MDGEPRQPPAAPRSPAPAPETPRPRFRISWWLIAITIGLFAVNYWAASRATNPTPRVRVPYTPFFIQQVDKGNVAEITSKGTAIQGSFKEKTKYGDSKPTTEFKTEVPAFANTDQLSQRLQSKGVIVNAEPLDTGPPWWQSLLLGFGPTLLFLLLLFWVFRRAGSAQGS